MQILIFKIFNACYIALVFKEFLLDWVLLILLLVNIWTKCHKIQQILISIEYKFYINASLKEMIRFDHILLLE